MCRLFIGAEPNLWKCQTRSFRMDGMVTSVRLENMFWMMLDEIAESSDLNIPQLLHQLFNESIDAGHDLSNFTSFLRVCCLRFVNLQLRGLLPQAGDFTLSTDTILRLEAAMHRERDKGRVAMHQTADKKPQ